MKKRILYLMMVSLLLTAALPASQESTGTDSLLTQWIREALNNNPKIEAAVHRTLSVEKTISQAGALPDPKVTLGLMNLPVNSFAFNQEPMTGKVISVMQMFPLPGRLSLKTEMAEYEAAAVKQQQEEIRNQIVAMVKKSYFSLYSIDQAIETIEKNMELMKQMIQIAEVKYSTGRGLQHDVLRAQVELSKLEDDLIMWNQKRLSEGAKLNALLDRPQGSTFEKIPSVLDLPMEEVAGISLEDLENQRPLLKAWHLRINKGESAVKLARKDFWPNITVGASYNQRDTLKSGMTMYDFFSTTVSVNIPLFAKRKQKAKIAERELGVRAMEAEYANVRSNVLAEIESLRAELDRNRKRVELYRGGILIQAQQSLDSAQAGYQVNKVDFMTLINNWMMLLKYELQYHFALSDYFKALAGFDLAVGQEVK